jgi:hypothetical protein
MTSSKQQQASDKYTGLVSKYIRYFNTRRVAHPEIPWVEPIQYQKMREEDQLFLYNQIYSAENSQMLNPTLLKNAFYETAKWLSAMSHIAAASGVIETRFDIGHNGDGRKSFAKHVEEMIHDGNLDDDFQQLWCEFAGMFESAGPHWRLGMRAFSALGKSLSETEKPAPMPLVRSETPDAELKKKLDSKTF